MNIAEILKDCPKGTKLYSLISGECELVCVERVDYEDKICVRSITRNTGYWFNHNGTVDRVNEGECLLFPSKENRDWSTFKVMPEFKKGDFEKGDFIVNRDGRVGIFECYSSPLRTKYSLLCVLDDNGLFVNNEGPIVWLNIEKIATEEEKQKLLKAIDESGYIWDEEKLELRKKRKKLKLIPNKYYTAVANCFHDGVCLLKIGHTYKGSDQEGSVVGEEGRLFIDWHDGIASTYLRHATLEEINEFEESRHKNHQFKPFDKVLVRGAINDIWECGVFSHKAETVYRVNSMPYKYCIPYEGNEHLLGTINNPE